ncbi:MAG: hypothetical protein SW019_11785 [Actinomycetota bacterium]|nr:hypothetical protein [Actinomycetota bacterium]
MTRARLWKTIVVGAAMTGLAVVSAGPATAGTGATAGSGAASTAVVASETTAASTGTDYGRGTTRSDNSPGSAGGLS